MCEPSYIVCIVIGIYLSGKVPEVGTAQLYSVRHLQRHFRMFSGTMIQMSQENYNI